MPINPLFHIKKVDSNGNNENIICRPTDPLATEFWAKLSLEGLYMRVTPPSLDVIGHLQHPLEEASIYSYVSDNNLPAIARALTSISKGSIANLQHTMRNQKGQYIPVVSTFYPGYIPNGIGSKPTFTLAQTRLQEIDKSKGANDSAMYNDPSRNDHENMFPELETVRSTCWQYELYQLQQANAKLRSQIETFTDDKKVKYT